MIARPMPPEEQVSWTRNNRIRLKELVHE